MSQFRSLAASATLGAALSAIAFGAGGGTQLGRTTTVEVAVILACGALLALGLLRAPSGPFHGGLALFFFALLAALTALSMAWSIAPDATMREVARIFAYLGVFAAAVIGGRLAPRALPAVVGGVLIAAVTVCGWALLTRIFPSDLGGLVLGGRLSEPFQYWNALGSMAAVGIPAAIWAGTRRAGPALAGALAYPSLGVLVLVLLLTQSRGALAATVIVTLLWVALVPLRLRTVTMLVLTGLAVAPVAAWALAKDPFTRALQSDAAREALAGDFGLMVLAMTAALFAAGLIVHTASARRSPSLTVRRRTGIAVAAVACIVPLAGLTSVAMSDRGLGGTISDRVHEVTDAKEGPPPGAARLGSVSSSRGSYWRQAYHVFEERPAVGRGAGGFELAGLKYRKGYPAADQAHGYVVQTAADLGVVGLAAVLALLAAWLAGVARATGFWPRGRPRPEWNAERTAVTGLALCAVVFGIHSFVDWTWYVPGPSAAALVAAGFVVGRGPLGAAEQPRERPRIGAGRVIAAVAAFVVAALCAWAAWQPQRAESATDRAFALASEGKPEQALRAAADARDLNPYSAEPLYARAAALMAAKRPDLAYKALEQAVIEHPRDPNAWLRLGHFELEELDLPNRAIDSAAGAQQSDPSSGNAMKLKAAARAAGG